MVEVVEGWAASKVLSDNTEIEICVVRGQNIQAEKYYIETIDASEIRASFWLKSANNVVTFTEESVPIVENTLLLV
jgi:hypothetical protein